MNKQTPTLKQMVSSLIAAPSVSSTDPAFDQSNQTVIDLLANWLDPLGFDVEVIPIVDRPGKSNLIARIGRGENGLLLSGHSDTVPFDSHLWQTDPFRMTEADDHWYGLGSCDMKSFFALAIEAARPFLEGKLQRPLVIMATADEESSMSGARALTTQLLSGVSHAVIGEPTDLKPITRHKGIMMMKLKVTGTSGHSSDPSLGNNAIEGMHEALAELMVYRQQLAQQHQDPLFEVAAPTMNFGCIHGGDNPNRICDHTELSFDLRNLPSMDMADFVGNLQERLTKCISPKGFHCDLSLLHAPVPAFENTGSVLSNDISALTGQESGAVAFGTEAPFLMNLDLDTVVIGAGSINQAHQPNEFLPCEQIAPAVHLLQTLIERHCLQP